MNSKDKLKIAIEALQDISNPIEKMKSNLSRECSLDGLMCIKLSDDPNYLKGIASTALLRLKETK
jgi:hypothetical protein